MLPSVMMFRLVVVATVVGDHIATVNVAVGDDVLGRDNVSRCERRPKSVNDLGSDGPRRQAWRPGNQDCIGSHTSVSSSQLPAGVPGDLYPRGDPSAHIRLKPPDRAQSQPHWLRESAVLDVLIDRAA